MYETKLTRSRITSDRCFVSVLSLWHSPLLIPVSFPSWGHRYVDQEKRDQHKRWSPPPDLLDQHRQCQRSDSEYLPCLLSATHRYPKSSLTSPMPVGRGEEGTHFRDFCDTSMHPELPNMTSDMQSKESNVFVHFPWSGTPSWSHATRLLQLQSNDHSFHRPKSSNTPWRLSSPRYANCIRADRNNTKKESREWLKVIIIMFDCLRHEDLHFYRSFMIAMTARCFKPWFAFAHLFEVSSTVRETRDLRQLMSIGRSLCLT